MKSIIQSIEDAIRQNACSVRYDTDTKYYNESYGELLVIGSKLKTGTAIRQDVVNLIGGLLAWNQGAKHAVRLSGAIDQFSKADSSLNRLIAKLNEFEKSDFKTEASKATIEEALRLSQCTLGISSVVIPSKLIHFLSPRFFAITDRNVAKGVEANTNSKHGYVKYIQTLWKLGFHEPEPRDSNFKNYWAKTESVYPMRAVDCTLYSIGKASK